MVEPLLCFQVTGGQFMSTSKGTYSTSTDFEQQLLLPVVNPSSDSLRLALYDLNEPKAASYSKFRCARILGKISNALSSGNPKVVNNPETTAREGAIAEEGPDVLYKEVGELQLPVRHLLHCKQVDLEQMLVLAIATLAIMTMMATMTSMTSMTMMTMTMMTMQSG